MPRLAVERVARGELHDPAEVHHRDPVRDVADHAEIVRDEEVGEPEPLLEVFEQVDHLGLDGHVERGDRLVADDELGVQRERPGHPDALALAAGELVRVAVGEAGVEPHRLEQLLDPLPQPPPLRDPVLHQGLPDDAAHRHARIQTVLRVLEDHLHARAKLAQGLAVEGGDVGPAEHDASRRRVVQAQDDATRGRFAAAALADQPQRLTLPDLEVEAIHRPDRADLAAEHAPHDREVPGEVLDPEERFGLGVHGNVHGRGGSRRRPGRRRTSGTPPGSRMGSRQKRPLSPRPAGWPPGSRTAKLTAAALPRRPASTPPHVPSRPSAASGSPAGSARTHGRSAARRGRRRAPA